MGLIVFKILVCFFCKLRLTTAALRQQPGQMAQTGKREISADNFANFLLLCVTNANLKP